MEKIINYRALAQGMKNKDGMQLKAETILRSGRITNATDQDIKTLMDLGVRYIYDFRSAHELHYHSTLLGTEFKTMHYDILSAASLKELGELRSLTAGEIKALMVDMYVQMFDKTAGFAEVFVSIAVQETSPFLFHCSAGKDRTGVFGSVLMLALGFDIETIVEEYLRINADEVLSLREEIYSQTGITKQADKTKLASLFTVQPEYLEAFLNAAVVKHGDYDAYLRDMIGITDEMKATLREKYLV